MIQKIQDSRLLTLYVVPFVIGALAVFGFAPFNFTFVNFIIIPIFFLLLSFVNKRSKSRYRKKKPYLRNLFFIGYFFGIGFFLSSTHWISNSLTFDENLRILIPFSVVMIPLGLGLFFGLMSLTIGPFIKNNFSSFILFCFALSVSDYLRGKIFSGFPWNLWSYSWSWVTEILQILNPIGLYCFNSLSIAFFCSPVVFFFNYRYKFLVFLTFLSIFFSFYIYGSYKINNDEKLISSNIETVNFKIISPNLKMRYIERDEEIIKTLKKIIRISEPNPEKQTIFVLPEGIFAGVYLEDLKKFSNIFKENFSKNHLIVFGVNTNETSSEKFYNSLVVVNNKFEILYKYNKKKLVPFGEFLPFNNFLEKFGLKKITYGYGSFSKGQKQENFKLKNLNILPLICYEIIFPNLTQNSDKKTNVIVNISEDAWFGDSIGPHQHFTKAIFRSIENNTYVIRSANKGFSAFINNNGNVLKLIKSNEAGNIELEVPLLKVFSKNRNDLIFFILLITYTLIFSIMRNLENK